MVSTFSTGTLLGCGSASESPPELGYVPGGDCQGPGCACPGGTAGTGMCLGNDGQPNMQVGGTGATGGGGTGGTGAGGDMGMVVDNTPAVVTPDPDDDAAYIFDPTQLRTFDVTISQQDLQRVDADPQAEEYVPATLMFEGSTYPVGYRYKGSYGAFLPPCTGMGSGFPSGPGKTGKCSVKLSFHFNNPGARFYGMKKLQFHSMNNDPSKMRERLSYALFREMGIPTARAVHAILRVNGEVQGFFALVEQIDGRFTRSRFPDGGEGNLYKEIWPVHDGAQTYLNALATNEDENPTVDKMLRFKDATRGGAGSMGSWLDLDMMARYLAVDRVIMNDDGIFHFWCSEGGAGNNPTVPGNHNYYWYESIAEDRMWLIPWDLDHAINDRTGQQLGVHINTDWTQPTGSCQCDQSYQMAPACDSVVQNFQSWIPQYEQKMTEFIAGPFSKQNVDGKLDTWQAQLEAGYQSLGSSAYNQSDLAELKQILDRARANRGFGY